MSTPDRPMSFIKALLFDHIASDTKKEKEWLELDIKEGLRYRKMVTKNMKLIQELERLEGYYSYKHGIGK